MPYNPPARGAFADMWNIAEAWNIAVRTMGVFLTAPFFRSPRAQKGAWCARRVNRFQSTTATDTF